MRFEPTGSSGNVARGAPVFQRRNLVANMLLEALSALMLASAAQAEAPPTSLAGRPVEDLNIAMRSRCPPMAPRIQSATPAELLRLEAGFRAQLTAPDRSRLDQAQGAGGHCPASGGPGCQARAQLSAIVDTDLVGAFADYVCAREAATTAPR